MCDSSLLSRYAKKNGCHPALTASVRTERECCSTFHNPIATCLPANSSVGVMSLHSCSTSHTCILIIEILDRIITLRYHFYILHYIIIIIGYDFSYTEEKLICYGSWEEDNYKFIILATRQSPDPQYALVSLSTVQYDTGLPAAIHV